MKKKILFFINTLSGGGAEKVLVTLVNHLDHEKYDITVHTFLDVGIYQGQLASHVKYKSILSMKYGIFSKILQYTIQFILPPKLVYSLFLKDNFDYECAFLEGVPTKILAGSTNKKAKKYAWVHIDLRDNSGHQKVYPKIAKQVADYKKYDKIISVSESVRTAFVEKFGIEDHLLVKYNVTDEMEILEKSKLPLKESLQKTCFTICTVGRLAHQKGYDRLLDVCRRLKQDGYTFCLWILGEGPDRPMLEGFIDDNDMRDYIKLLGFQPNPYQFMRMSDLFVCSSRVEGFSTVITEAIVLGLPIITTNCAGANELLDFGKYGVIVENDSDALYHGMKSLLEDKPRYQYYKQQVEIHSEHFKKAHTLAEVEEVFS